MHVVVAQCECGLYHTALDDDAGGAGVLCLFTGVDVFRRRALTCCAFMCARCSVCVCVFCSLAVCVCCAVHVGLLLLFRSIVCNACVCGGCGGGVCVVGPLFVSCVVVVCVVFVLLCVVLCCVFSDCDPCVWSVVWCVCVCLQFVVWCVAVRSRLGALYRGCSGALVGAGA